MPVKTNIKNCDGQAEPRHCEDHSGLITWNKGIATLLAFACGLLSYSVFWQAPNIRLDIAKEIARLDKEDQTNAYKIQTIETDVKDIGRRVSLLERK